MRWTVAIFSAVILGMSMLAVVDAQSPGDQKPQTLLLQAQPSALPSPVAVNEYDSPRTDGEGNVWTRIRGTVTSTISNLLTADQDSSGGTQTGAIVGIAVPASGGAVQVGGTAQGLKVTPTHVDGTALTGAYGVWAQGPVSHDDTAGGNPILTGGYASTYPALPSAVSTGDAVRYIADEYGRPRCTLESSGGNRLAINDFGGATVSGPYGHDDSIVSRIPVLTGGITHATGTLPTAVSANGDAAMTLHDAYGRARVSMESANGAAIADDNGLLVQVRDSANTANGHSVKYEASHAGGSSEVTAKGSGGLLKWINVTNPNTTDVWLQIHDATNPTIGSATPLVAFVIPGGTGASNRAIYNQEFGPVGITFATAITYTITTTAGGSTAPSSAVSVALGYK